MTKQVLLGTLERYASERGFPSFPPNYSLSTLKYAGPKSGRTGWSRFAKTRRLQRAREVANSIPRPISVTASQGSPVATALARATHGLRRAPPTNWTRMAGLRP